MCLIFRKKAIESAFNEMYTISQVADRHSDFKVPIKRDKIKIYVLDDEGFNADPLISVGYTHIKKYTKFEHIEDYEDADIILCDIDGIGGDLDIGRQGIAVAENLKETYPNKTILLYTSKNVESYGEKPKNLEVIRKQVTMNDLAYALDEAYKKEKDVIGVWERVKREMIEDNIATKVIALTEHYYCKSLLERHNMFEESRVSEFVSMANILKFASVLADIITIVSAFNI